MADKGKTSKGKKWDPAQSEFLDRDFMKMNRNESPSFPRQDVTREKAREEIREEEKAKTASMAKNMTKKSESKKKR